MIGQIKVTPNADNLQVELSFLTPQEFFYEIKVMKPDGSVPIDLHGKSGMSGSSSLGKAVDLLGSYLLIAWTIIDPAGAGNTYCAHATVSQNGVPCPSPQVCAGR